MNSKPIQFQNIPTQDLDIAKRELVEQAKAALKNAYAPYSKFQVGAAVLLDNGEVITGSNQENVAYPSGLCAERVALFYAQHKYPHAKVKALTIAAEDNGKALHEPIMPCGACVQVMSETVKRNGESFEVILCADDHVMLVPDALNFIPFRFDL